MFVNNVLPSSEVDDALQSQIELIKTGKQLILYEREMTTNVIIVYGFLKMIITWCTGLSKCWHYENLFPKLLNCVMQA